MGITPHRRLGIIMEKNKVRNRSELIIYIVAILGLIVVGNFIATRMFKRIDMTEGKEYSVSKPTKKVLKSLDDIINIKVYFSNNLPPNLHNTVTNVKDLLSEYQAFAGKNLHISWEDPSEDEATKETAQSLGIPEIQMQTFEKDKQQVINGYLGIAVLYEDKKEALPVVQNLQNLEYDLTMAIMKVSRKSIPKIGILKMDSLPSLPPQYQQKMDMSASTEKKYEQLIKNLSNNYDVPIVDLANGTPIDSTIKTLIVPGIENITTRKIFEIDQFFMKGGNLIVLADAVGVQFQYGVRAFKQDSKLFDLLEHYGVRIEKELVMDASCGQVTVPQKFGQFQMNVAVPYPYFVKVGKDGLNAENPAVAPLSEIVLPWVSPLTLLVDQTDSAKGTAKVTATVLAHSSKKSWKSPGTMDLNPQQKWAMPPEAEMSAQNLIAHVQGSFTSFFAGKKIPPVKEANPSDTLSMINLQSNAADNNRPIVPANTQGHLIVVGDADFIGGQNATPQNLSLLYNLTDWLSLDNNLIAIRTRSLKDRTMNSDLLQKSSSKPSIIRLVNIILMPFILALVGIAIYLRRREVITPIAHSATPETAPVKEEEKK